ncbi:MAG: DUF935 domain-containing protein [Rhodospirillaceae bacterium]|nr:DUF935 domain-containing protein [Rhodospirillaceae bacterium]
MPELIDQYGRPIRKELLTQEVAGPTVAGVRSVAGAAQQIRAIDIQRVAAILRESTDGDPIRYLELAEEMEERDLHYLAVLGTRRRQVAQLKISVEPVDDSAEAEADAELLRDWLRHDELEDEIFDLLDAIGKGFAVSEIIWETSEGQWMPERLEYRLPQWFRYDRETGARLQRRGDGFEWLDLEPAKFVVHQHQAKSGLPIRGGLARAAAWAWVFKLFGTRDWLRFVEAYGHPLRVGKFDKSAQTEDRAILLRAVTNIASDAAAIIPEGMSIEFIENAGTGVRSDLYRDLLGYFDNQVSKAVLGQTLTMQEGEGGSGSYALGKVHNEVRHDIERSDARQLAATLTRAVGVPLVFLNRGMRRKWPRFVIGREEQTDTGLLAEVLAKLVPLGLNVRSAEVRGHLGLTDPGEGDEVLGPAAPPPADAGPEAARAFSRAMARAAGQRGDAIDAAVATLLAGEGWEPMMEPVIEPILAAAGAALERGDSLEDFRAQLPGLFADMDDSRLVETLHRMGFTAALSGQAGLDDA